MVMDTVSSTKNTTDNDNSNSLMPQTVGREFVRQYYTMLNRGPHFLHRFYNNDSSFVHGSVDRPGEVSNPVFGRDAIGKKIESLNFRDCHAKILQVDSMETIANGVVIQVTGELSNNGQRMRRFLQTFVLAPLSANKYYLRNDIFRYQDEIFSDDDEFSETEKADIEMERNELDVHQQSNIIENVESNDDTGSDYYENTNGNVHETVLGDEKSEIKHDGHMTDSKVISNDGDLIVEEELVKSDDYIGSSPLQQQSQQNELKTYANMVKNPNTTFGPPFSSPIPNNTFVSGMKAPSEAGSLATAFTRPSETSPTPVIPQTTVAPFLASPVSSYSGKPPTVGNPQPQRDQQRTNRQRQYANKRTDSREMTPGRGGMNDADFEGEYNNRKQYPDEQQVFVGNLPQNIVEDDLLKLFSKYGKILDVRINRQNQKLGSSNKTPNYGFVTFESPDIVHYILKQKPIYFNDHRFNVEEKRSQQGRGIQGMGGNVNRGGSFSGQSGGGFGGRINTYGNTRDGNRSHAGGGNNRDRDRDRDRNRGNQPFVPNIGNNARGGGMNSGGSGGGFGGNRNSFNKQTR